jgi:hypothetical protein
MALMAIPLHNCLCRISTIKHQSPVQFRFVQSAGDATWMNVNSMALNARNHTVASIDALIDLRQEPDLRWCDLALDLAPGPAYNEHAFRYFLANEQKRSAISNRPFLLLLVDLQKQANVSEDVEPVVAERLFSGLAVSLRDTDVIGWYHDNRVVGAVLTHIENASDSDVTVVIGERVSQTLRGAVSPSVANRLRVHVYRMPAGLSPNALSDDNGQSRMVVSS